MLEYILFIIGIFLLIKGADYLVEGSSSLAKKLGISSLVIGLTIVAIGTSTPELVVNIIAAMHDKGDVGFGNIVGSSLANILLILGLSAAIASLRVQKSTIWKEIPFAFLASLVLLVFAGKAFLNSSGNQILRSEGIILLIFFSIFLYYVFELARSSKSENKKEKDEKNEIRKHSGLIIFIMIVGGLLALYLGGKWTVEGAVAIARAFGLSEYFIGLTIIAVGTSLPELFTSIIAAKKKDVDLAVGNIVGSNIVNIFLILGITSIISPLTLPAYAITDLLILAGATFLLFLFTFTGKKHEIERWEGALFLLLYILYIAFLIMRG